MKHETLYDVLNVSEKSTSDEIKKRYRELAKIYHPDKNSNSDESKTLFQLINKAYQVLGSPEKRKLYDRFIESSGLKRGQGSRHSGLIFPDRDEIITTAVSHLNYILWEIDDIRGMCKNLPNTIIKKVESLSVEILFFMDKWVLSPAGQKDYFYDSRKINNVFDVSSLSESECKELHRPYVNITDYLSDIRKRLSRFEKHAASCDMGRMIDSSGISLIDSLFEVQMLSYHNLRQMRGIINSGEGQQIMRYRFSRNCFSMTQPDLIGC